MCAVARAHMRVCSMSVSVRVPPHAVLGSPPPLRRPTVSPSYTLLLGPKGSAQGGGAQGAGGRVQPVRGGTALSIGTHLTPTALCF